MAFLYLRVQDSPNRPEQELRDKTFEILPGGSMDVLVREDSAMGPGLVTYTPGLKGYRKNTGDRILYRFHLPEDSKPGSVWAVSAGGCAGQPAFTFQIRAARQ